MSVQAITWAIEDAPDVPAHCVSLLIGLANHADQDGRNSFPGQGTLAAYTRKSDRAVRNDLAELEARRLIARGDQRLVAHIPGDRRPVVWDLSMQDAGKAASARQARRAQDTNGHDRKPTSAREPATAGSGVPDGRKPTTARPEVQYQTTGSGLPTNRQRTVPEPSGEDAPEPDKQEPRFAGRCSEHGDDAEPPNCGPCADARRRHASSVAAAAPERAAASEVLAGIEARVRSGPVNPVGSRGNARGAAACRAAIPGSAGAGAQPTARRNRPAARRGYAPDMATGPER